MWIRHNITLHDVTQRNIWSITWYKIIWPDVTLYYTILHQRDEEHRSLFTVPAGHHLRYPRYIHCCGGRYRGRWVRLFRHVLRNLLHLLEGQCRHLLLLHPSHCLQRCGLRGRCVDRCATAPSLSPLFLSSSISLISLLFLSSLYLSSLLAFLSLLFFYSFLSLSCISPCLIFILIMCA